MNSDKLDQWQDEIKSIRIDGIDDMIRRKIEKQKANYYVRIVKTALVSSLTVFIAFALLVNLSPQFYTFAYNNKILGPIADILKIYGREDTKSAFDLDYAQEVNIKLRSGDYELDIDYFISDIYSVSLFGRLYFKGKPYAWKLGDNPEIELLDEKGELLSKGFGLRTYQDYSWVEMQLIRPNPFKSITVRFSQDINEPRKSVTGELKNPPEKAVTIIKQPLKKSFTTRNQTVIFDQIEIGALQSRIILHGDVNNSMELGSIDLKILYQDYEIQDSQEWSPVQQIHDLAIGQLMKPGPLSFELVSATFTDKAYTEIDFNLNTLKKSELPSFLTMMNLKKENYRITFTIVNSRGNTVLMDIKSFFEGNFGMSHDPFNPGETKFFIECNNQYAPNIKIRFRESMTLPFYDAKFIVQW